MWWRDEASSHGEGTQDMWLMPLVLGGRVHVTRTQCVRREGLTSRPGGVPKVDQMIATAERGRRLGRRAYKVAVTTAGDDAALSKVMHHWYRLPELGLLHD